MYERIKDFLNVLSIVSNIQIMVNMSSPVA